VLLRRNRSQREPIFHTTGLDHILLDVTDPEKSAGFYQEIFGPVTQRNNNRTWFSDWEVADWAAGTGERATSGSESFLCVGGSLRVRCGAEEAGTARR
jgi:hypothetical protein